MRAPRKAYDHIARSPNREIYIGHHLKAGWGPTRICRYAKAYHNENFEVSTVSRFLRKTRGERALGDKYEKRLKQLEALNVKPSQIVQYEGEGMYRGKPLKGRLGYWRDRYHSPNCPRCGTKNSAHAKKCKNPGCWADLPPCKPYGKEFVPLPLVEKKQPEPLLPYLKKPGYVRRGVAGSQRIRRQSFDELIGRPPDRFKPGREREPTFPCEECGAMRTSDLCPTCVTKALLRQRELRTNVRQRWKRGPR